MSYQRFLWTLLLLTLLPTTLAAWLILPASAATLRVPQDYPTIQAAINAAHTGDIIEVDTGTYPENVIVNQTVTIIGKDSATTIVDGGGNNIVFNIQANNVELNNLTIYNGGRRYSGVRIDYPYDGLIIRNTRITDNVVGVIISEADGNTIEDNIFANNLMYGIDVKYSSNTIIRNNQMSDGAYGIEISDTSNSHVLNNTISGTSYGIYVPYSNNNNISINTLTSNSWNIYLTHSNSNIIGYNDVSGGSVGIQVMRSEGNSVLNNTASDSSYGIYLGYCGANTVSGNTASLNDWGIELYNSMGSTIFENMILDNTWGAYIVENSDGNSIYHNNFIDNVKQVYQDLTSLNTWRTPTTPYQGNYWSDYKGKDTDGDGIGDTYLPWNGVDYYPLIVPWGFYPDIAIVSVAPFATVAYAGYPINITVTVSNLGTTTETFDVTVYCNSTAIGTQTVIDLAPGENSTLVFTWNTTAVPLRAYTISAETSPVLGDVNLSNNSLIDGIVHVNLAGDVNGDRTVDILDAGLISAHWYPGPPVGPLGYDVNIDINKDGRIDIIEAAIVNGNWHES